MGQTPAEEERGGSPSSAQSPDLSEHLWLVGSTDWAGCQGGALCEELAAVERHRDMAGGAASF